MADQDVTISQLIRQMDLLSRQMVEREQTNARLQHQIEQLRAENQRLKDQIARLTRDSSNSSKPPSSDIVKPKKKDHRQARRNRKIGGQPGHPREERTPFGPDQIDRTIHHELSPARSRGLVPLEEWFVLQQVEWDLEGLPSNQQTTVPWTISARPSPGRWYLQSTIEEG